MFSRVSGDPTEMMYTSFSEVLQSRPTRLHTPHAYQNLNTPSPQSEELVEDLDDLELALELDLRLCFRGQDSECSRRVFCPDSNSAIHFLHPDLAASANDTTHATIALVVASTTFGFVFLLFFFPSSASLLPAFPV